MSTLVSDCPRCGVKKCTFDVMGVVYIVPEGTRHPKAETFSCCRSCGLGTVFLMSDVSHPGPVFEGSIQHIPNNINSICDIDGFVSIVDFHTANAPEHLPESVERAFSEGAKAYSAGCWNAAACMFRASIDIATKDLLPKEDVDDLDDLIRRYLARRLKWLFRSGRLPRDLEGLASCVKEDGDEAVHSTTLDKNDAVDLLEFTTALLERMYTEPQRVKLAEQRRRERRAKADGAPIG